MPRRGSSKEPRRKESSKKAQRALKKKISIKNPIDPDGSVWEIELLDTSEEAFLALWDSSSDRIGFNLGERTIYDKTRPIARIVKEVRLSRRGALEEE